MWTMCAGNRTHRRGWQQPRHASPGVDVRGLIEGEWLEPENQASRGMRGERHRRRHGRFRRKAHLDEDQREWRRGDRVLGRRLEFRSATTVNSACPAEVGASHRGKGLRVRRDNQHNDRRGQNPRENALVNAGQEHGVVWHRRIQNRRHVTGRSTQQTLASLANGGVPTPSLTTILSEYP